MIISKSSPISLEPSKVKWLILIFALNVLCSANDDNHIPNAFHLHHSIAQIIMFALDEHKFIRVVATVFLSCFSNHFLTLSLQSFRLRLYIYKMCNCSHSWATIWFSLNLHEMQWPWFKETMHACMHSCSEAFSTNSFLLENVFAFAIRPAIFIFPKTNNKNVFIVRLKMAHS